MLDTLKEKGFKFKIDSRKIEKGDIFLCLRGEKTNGHLFIEDALNRGASYVIVDEEYNKKQEERIIKVENVLKEMLESSAKILNKGAKIKIGITGSNGKTTTKECLYYLLSQYFTTFRNEMNMNTEIGIPLSILNSYNKEEISILEAGLRKKGDLEFLTQFYQFDVVIITNIGASHLEYLENIENVAQEKMKITNNMKKGLLIINGDFPLLKESAPKHLNILTFGTNNENDAILKDYEYNYNNTTTVYANIFGQEFMLTLSEYWSEGQILDLLACILFLIYLELPIDPYYIFKIKIPQDRFQIIRKGNSIIINDSYNASYESFINAFKSLDKLRISPKIMIMGEMKELGKNSKEYHKKVLEEAKKIFDYIYFYDPNKEFSIFLKSDDKTVFFENIEQIKEILLKHSEKGLIYIKGSHATGINQYIKESGLL